MPELKNEALYNALHHAALKTVSVLCMLLPEEEECELNADAQTTSVEIGFDGPCSGRLEVSAIGDTLDEAAETMCAADDEISDELRWDVLGEIANVVCGNLLPSVFGARSVFDVCAPVRLESDEQSARGQYHQGAEVTLHFDDGSITFSLYLAEEAENLLCSAAPRAGA